MNTFKEKSIHFGTEHQNNRKVVEEEQKDNGKTNLPSVVFEEVLCVEREKVQE